MNVLTVGFVGGMPRALGGGGLELQMRRTAVALRARGHRVLDVTSAAEETRFDVMHGFHAEALIAQWLPWWRKARCPMVLSPVLSVQPGVEATLVRLTARVPFAPLSSRVRRAVLGQAAQVVVLTEWERAFVVGSLGVPQERVTRVSNGVDLLAADSAPSLPAGVRAKDYVLLVGAVTARKRQVETIEALGGARSVVVVGGAPSDPEERERWARAAARPEVTWLGQIDDRRMVQRLQRCAAALALMSSGEVQSLAVLECLAVGTPVLLSDIPVHRELRMAYPDLVRLARRPKDVGTAIACLPSNAAPAPVPSWDDVAASLELVYERALAA